MGKTSIIVACHKSDPLIRKDDLYCPIHVGKALNPTLDLEFQGDDTGDNISKKNKAYNELTALYWAWKNIKDKEYIGLCHYRRYFPSLNIEKILKKYDVIAVNAVHMHSIAIELSLLIPPEEVAIMIDTILELYPESRDIIVKYFYRNNVAPQCNMFITKRETLDTYCSQLFEILNKIESKIRPSHYSRLQRNIGYMGEVIMGFLFIYNNFKVKYVKCDGFWKNTPYKDMFRTIRNRIVFSLMIKPKTPLVFPAVITGLRQDGIGITHLLE